MRIHDRSFLQSDVGSIRFNKNSTHTRSIDKTTGERLEMLKQNNFSWNIEGFNTPICSLMERNCECHYFMDYIVRIGY